MYWIYQAAWGLLFITISPLFLAYTLITGKHRTGLGQRLGFHSNGKGRRRRTASPRIWIHAASVGEVKAAAIVIKELRDSGATFLLTTMTEQGYRQASNTLAGQTEIFLAPLDLGIAVRRTLAVMQPDIYLCLETELWPAMLRNLKKRGIPALLLNGRISERSWRRYRRIRGLVRPLLQSFQTIAAISDDDASRFADLGAASIRVCGNLKYDWQDDTDSGGHYARLLGLRPDDTVFLCGSTHADEETRLIETYRFLRARIGRLLWLVAPRHLERIPEIEQIFARHHLAYDRFSDIRTAGRRHEIVLVDTIGDLAGLYAVATAAFCGGSLVPRGGHNIMEAAAQGCPVFYGPHMKDFEDARHMLESAGAGFTINDPAELGHRLLALFQDKEARRRTAERGRALADRQKGAARRQTDLVKVALRQVMKKTSVSSTS